MTLFNETFPFCYFFDNEDSKHLCINLRICKWSSDPGWNIIDVWKNEVTDPILSLIDTDGAYTLSSIRLIALPMFVWPTNFLDIIHEYKNVACTCLSDHIHFVTLESSSVQSHSLVCSYNPLYSTHNILVSIRL